MGDAKVVRPIEWDIIHALRAHEASGRGEIRIVITPENIDIQEGRRRRYDRKKSS